MPEVSLLLVSTKPGDFEKAKLKLEKGLKDAGALDAIRVALHKTKGDMFYRLRDVEGLDNRSSSPPPSPSSSPSPVPSYIVTKQSTTPTSAHASTSSALYSTAKLMSLFSPSSSSGNTPTSTNTPPIIHRPQAHQNGRASTPTPPATKFSPANVGRPYNSTYTSVSKSTPNSNDSNNNTPTSTSLTHHRSSSHPPTPTRYHLPPERNCLLHFLYKDQKANQFTCPRMEAPYSSPEDRKRLFRLYQHVNVIATGAMWQGNTMGSGGGGGSALKKKKDPNRPHKVYYHTSDRESVLAWLTPGFELYATFGPMASKANAIRICNQLLRWIKSEEEHLFIQNTPVW